jgi:hypothetical protein
MDKREIRIQAKPKLSITKKGKNEEFSCLKMPLLGWRLLLEPECPLKGVKKFFDNNKNNLSYKP